LVAVAAACLPRGDPPAGRQLVADRTTTLVGIVRPNGDGITRVLIVRPASDATIPYALDLFVVSADSAGGPPVERLLAASLPGGFAVGCGAWVTECFRTDARGRLLVTTSSDANRTLTTMARIDPVAGDRLELGAVSYDLLSPNGERLVVFTGDGLAAEATLYEADDRVIPLGRATDVGFVGEVLLFVAAQQELMRILPGGAPERVATGVVGVSQQMTDGDRLIVLFRPTADPMVNAASVLDVVTLEETPGPPGALAFTLSPSGRWFYRADFETGLFTFIDRATSLQDVVEFPPYRIGSYEWRPGHDEVWFQNAQIDPAQARTISIKKPGAPAVEIPGSLLAYSDGSGRASSFTHDGVYWFSSPATSSERPIVQVGSADDPTGDRFDLAPAGTFSFNYWPLADGRLLVPASVRSALDRNDLYVVAPATGSSQLVGESGLVLAVGDTRLLVSAFVSESKGDLTAIELATGRATVLAPEFALGAFVEREGADPVAPGARVAFQFQARFSSPYDGIWLTTVP